MPDDYNYKMSDLEYKKFKLKQSVEGGNLEFLLDEYKGKKKPGQAELFVGERRFECNVSELAESDYDVNGGDNEDNITLNSDDLRDKSMSLGGDEDKNEGNDEFNLNLSLTGGYVPNTDLTRVDKGQGNPQFAGLEIKV